MAGAGFSAKDVELLLQKLTIKDGPALTEDDRGKLITILTAVRAASSSSSQRPVLTDAEIGDTELRDLLTQLLHSFTPGSSPGSITQINIFSKISPIGDPGGGGPKISPAEPAGGHTHSAGAPIHPPKISPAGDPDEGGTPPGAGGGAEGGGT
jgi:hypothetical protein